MTSETYTPEKGAVEENWQALRILTWNTIIDQNAQHKDMLNRLEADQKDPHGYTLLGAKRAPAAMRNHHAFEGGWCYHVHEMWGYWTLVRPTLQPHETITDERILGS